MITQVILQNIWFILVGVLLIGYSILDGFDLGVGALLPFLAEDEQERRVLFNAVGPFWDGNEVWLLTGGGALFAAFPQAYATVFSGFYLALMLVLFALIFRAVALEFWSYDEKRRGFWRWAFTIGSFLPSLLYGVALGNVIVGVPLDGNMEYGGNFFTLLRPFPLVIGLLGLVAILLQGSTFAAMKSEGKLQSRAKSISEKLWIAYIVLFVLSFIASLIFMKGSGGKVLAYAATLVVIVSLVLYRLYTRREAYGRAMIASSVAFAGLWGIAGAIHYPNLVLASNDRSLSLTIYNASSSALTLKVMFIIALIGMPLVIAYTIFAYRVFKGKVRLEENH